MDVIVWITIGVLLGVATRVIAPRGGVGGIIGDIAAGLLGAAFGAYIVNTVALYHILTLYLFWILAVSGGAATGVLLVYRALTNQSDIENEALRE